MLAVSNLCYALATRDGGDDLTGKGALALAADHRGLYVGSTVAALAACLLFVPATLGLMRTMRDKAPGAGTVGASLMLVGYVCYFAVAFGGLYTIAMADLGGSQTANAAILDRAADSPVAIPLFVLFVLGNIVGTAIVAVGLLRGRVVAQAAAFGVLAWPVLHIAGLAAGTEWFEVIGALLMTAGLAAVARRVLTTPPDSWDIAAGRSPSEPAGMREAVAARA
jgi:hypothetical protein